MGRSWRTAHPFGWTADPRARALYERLGFAFVGETDDEVQLEWRSA